MYLNFFSNVKYSKMHRRNLGLSLVGEDRGVVAVCCKTKILNL